MKRVAFMVPGRIGGKQRHSSFVHRGKMIHKTKPQTASQEAIVKHYAHTAMVKDRIPLLRGPLKMHIEVWRNFPKSWSAKKCAVTGYITGKPDFDNTAKLIADALNGICYLDDSQIADGRLVRRYADAAERINVVVEELSDNIPPPRQNRRHMLEPV